MENIPTKEINKNELSPEAQKAIEQAKELKEEITQIEKDVESGNKDKIKGRIKSLGIKAQLVMATLLSLLLPNKGLSKEISNNFDTGVEKTIGVENSSDTSFKDAKELSAKDFEKYGDPEKKEEGGKKEKADDMKVLSREEFYKKEMGEGLNKNPKTVEEIEQNLDKEERVIGFEEKDGSFMLVVGNFEDQVEKGGDAIPFDKINEVKKSVSKLPLFNRADMGTIAQMENADGKYALQARVEGNTIILDLERKGTFYNENIKKLLNIRNYNEDALKKIADQVHVKVYDVDGNLVGQTTFNL